MSYLPRSNQYIEEAYHHAESPSSEADLDHRGQEEQEDVRSERSRTERATRQRTRYSIDRPHALAKAVVIRLRRVALLEQVCDELRCGYTEEHDLGV